MVVVAAGSAVSVVLEPTPPGTLLSVPEVDAVAIGSTMAVVFS